MTYSTKMLSPTFPSIIGRYSQLPTWKDMVKDYKFFGTIEREDEESPVGQHRNYPHRKYTGFE